MSRVDVSGSPRRPLHPGLIAAGSTLLIATFASDLLYWRTLLFQWNNVAGWLLAAGLVLAALAAIAFIVDVVIALGSALLRWQLRPFWGCSTRLFTAATGIRPWFPKGSPYPRS
jgi:uncharacterized membrane protein